LLSALAPCSITRAVFFVTFGLFTGAKQVFASYFDSLKCFLSLMTLNSISASLTPTFFRAKLPVLEAFTIRFQTLSVLTIAKYFVIILLD
jgi:hypothetical protein